jgi:LL-diaminopimelate aminotransferase
VSVPPINRLLAEAQDYPFVRLERRVEDLAPADRRLIRFSAGDPREETPAFIREAVRDAIPIVSSYPTVAGDPALRAAFAGWYQRRYGVALDPERHVLPANGSKEAVFLLGLAVLSREGDPRRTVVIPTPAYPVYEQSTLFAGGEIHFVPVERANGWRFDPASVPEDVWSRTALLWLNDPHNPTGSVLEPRAHEDLMRLARRFGFWVAGDHAYDELWFDPAHRPHSVLEHGLESAIAFHTLSKRSAMTGYRSGFMAGDERLIGALRRFRPSVGVATPEFVQKGAIAAWSDDAHTVQLRERYAAKRTRFLEYFARRGWQVEASVATFYLWMRVPDGDDVGFVERLIRAGVVATPGSYLGAGGEGFVRWALVPTLAECDEALRRLDAVADTVSR